MRDDELLQQAAQYFKVNYPGLTPEAVVAFFIILDQPKLTVAGVALAMGKSKQHVEQHLTALSQVGGVGLLALQAAPGGDHHILMTGRGEQVKAAILSSLAG